MVGIWILSAIIFVLIIGTLRRFIKTKDPKVILVFLVVNFDIIICWFEFIFLRYKFLSFKLISGKKLKEINSKNLSIYHIYTKFLSKDNKDFLEFLSKNNFHIIISSSLPLSSDSIDYLKNSNINYSLFYKYNVGRDIHSYKFFYKKIQKLHIGYENLLFCNDSLFFIKELSDSLDKKVNDFFNDPQKTVAALTINYVAHAHLGSFFVMAKNDRAINKRLNKYFRWYVPLSSRVWSIKYGECGLSDALRYPHQYHVSIFYTNSNFLKIDNLEKISFATFLLNLINTQNYGSNPNANKDNIIPAINKNLSIIQSSISNPENNNKKYVSTYDEKIIRGNYVDTLGQSVLEMFNPTHALALNHILAGFPFLKKDILKVYSNFSTTHIVTVLKLCNINDKSVQYYIDGLISKNYKLSYGYKSFVYKIKNEVFL